MWFLRTTWTAVTGQNDIPLLVGSLFTYCLACAICLLLQRSFKLLLPQHLYSFAADFCFTMVVCAYPYSHGTVRQLYGHFGYIVAAVSVMSFTAMIFEGTPSPLGVFLRYLKGEETLLPFMFRVVIQVIAACMSYRLVYFIWSMEVTDEHRTLMKAGCESDLRVPVVLGCLLEFSSVVYDTWLSHQQLFKSSHLDTLVKNVNGAVLVCAGFQLTGMYMHPAMATGMSFNCKGTSTFEHICVYWVAAFLGCFGGVSLNSVFHLPMSSDGKTKDADVANGLNRMYGKAGDKVRHRKKLTSDGLDKSNNNYENNNVKKSKVQRQARKK